MKLSTVIRQARRGELKSLSAKDKTDEVIVDYVNLGLIALYNKFQLKTEEAIITMKAGKTIYTMDGTDPDVSISNTEIVQFVEAYDEAGRIEINDEDDPRGIFTVGYNQIQIPVTEDGEYISVIYRGGVDEVTFVDAGGGTATEQNIPLPNSLLIALLHYIGYRAHGAEDGQLNAENNTHLMRFEAACKEAADLGLVPSDTPNKDVEEGGFL